MVLTLPKDKILWIMDEIKRVTKDGGYIEWVESYLKGVRCGPIMTKAINQNSLHLDSLMSTAGLEDIEEDFKSLPIGWGGPLGDLFSGYVRALFVSFRAFIQRDDFSDADYAALPDQVLAECAQAKSFANWYYACGRVRK
ncbi:hypothetical protein HK405_012624 [Cladochytrium tenue]|nr:hypothetical protein HK405_012624 [Cladochytrium tenue]